MKRICEHIPNEKGTNCTICGTNKAQMMAGYTCIWRDVEKFRIKKEYGIYDSETISKRLRELKAEKDNMINHIDKEIGLKGEKGFPCDPGVPGVQGDKEDKWDGLLA